MKILRTMFVFVTVTVTVPLTLLLPSVETGETTPLSVYVKHADGSYGYDESQAVALYPGSDERVAVPTEYEDRNRQLKSAWVATISNLNFPKPTSAEDFRTKYAAVLDDFERWNMNAMIFQVRPANDAYYPSSLNPWSEYLSGTQGVPPGYNPLELMVDETHKRGMEYHAWLNPYRVTNVKMTDESITARLGLTASESTLLEVPEYIAALNKAGILADGNYAVLHPEHVLIFEEKLFLDPGRPEVQQFVVDTVAEIIATADVDAIHFDDYFYPYRITVDGENKFFGEAGEDRNTFEEHGLTAGYPDTQDGIESWRRDNITSLITLVGDAIDGHNTATSAAVQFGVSPFGIWEHVANDPHGSNTPTSSSQTQSGAVFADTRRWVKDELVDYLAPQIYWSFSQAAAPYGELARWWDEVAEGTHVQIYTGHALYKHVSNGGFDAAWMNPEEIPNQLRYAQELDNISGSVLFSYNDMQRSDLDRIAPALQPKHGVKNTAISLLQGEAFAAPSLVPAKPWLSHGTPSAPTTLRLDAATESLSWKATDQDSTRMYAVYAGTGTPEEIIASPGTLVETVWAGGASDFELTIGEAWDESLTWIVTALDAAAVESQPAVAQADGPEATPTVTSSPSPSMPATGGAAGGSSAGTTPPDGTHPGASSTPVASGNDAVTAEDLAVTGAEPWPLLAAVLSVTAAGTLAFAVSRRQRSRHRAPRA